MGDKHFEQAYKMHMAGDRQAARKLYERIVKKTSKHVNARYMLGTLLAESGEYELALMHLKAAGSRMPNSPMIQTNIGNVFLKLGMFDEARISYQRSLKLDAKIPETHFNLGVILQRKGELEQAARHIEKSLDLKPDFPVAYFKLGRIHRELNHPELAAACLIKMLEYVPDSIEALFELGNIYAAHQDFERALVHFRRILELDPTNDSAKHVVAALTGETTASAPRKHVEQLFDELSVNFDSHLDQLGYRVPEQLFEMILKSEGVQNYFDQAIDLGCGTGLSGEQFRPMVAHFTGLDLSPNMIKFAREKGIYDELEIAEICQYLESSQKQYDLFLATDVFIYIGDLSNVFRMIGSKARQGAYFLFSVEESVGQDFVLRPTGRYAHSRAYIEKLAKIYDFSIISAQSIDLRMEGKHAAKGELFILKFS